VARDAGGKDSKKFCAERVESRETRVAQLKTAALAKKLSSTGRKRRGEKGSLTEYSLPTSVQGSLGISLGKGRWGGRRKSVQKVFPKAPGLGKKNKKSPQSSNLISQKKDSSR